MHSPPFISSLGTPPTVDFFAGIDAPPEAEEAAP